MKKISVIVPVYNVEKYIRRCVTSITSQSYQELEIILVDDGTRDQSGEICRELQKRDKRIQIIQQENMGLSGARNTGMRAASGDYCMFVDGDDWLGADCIKRTSEEMDKGYDIILFPYKKEYASGCVEVKLFEKQRAFSKEEVRNYLLRRLFGPLSEELKKPVNMEHLSTAWGKLYRYEVIRELCFTDTKKIGTEDMWFNIQTFYNSNRIKYIDSVFYHYNKVNQNALTRTYKPGLSENWNTLYLMQKNFIKEKGLGREFDKALENRRIINLLSLVLNIGLSEMAGKKKIRELKILLENEQYAAAFQQFIFSDLPLKWRIFYRLCYKRAAVLLFLICALFKYLSKIRGNK